MMTPLINLDNTGKIVFEKCYCDKNVGENFIETFLNLEEKLLLYIVKNKEIYLQIMELQKQNLNISIL